MDSGNIWNEITDISELAMEKADSGGLLRKEEVKKPPANLEEFIQMEGLESWPEHITSENPLPAEPGSVLGGKENIFELLREAAPLVEQLSILSGLEKRVLSLEGNLTQFTDLILTAEHRPSRIKDKTFYSNFDSKGTFMTELVSRGAQRTGQSGSGSKELHTVDGCTYPGFNFSELTELPAKIETPQLLNKVTKSQEFEIQELGFSKFWKKTFLSDASVALVQDTFWWIFLRVFPPRIKSVPKDAPGDETLLFDRMADSFAALFLSVHPDLKDKIFSIYPDVLAQAIFAIFYSAFQRSRSMFGPKFKQELVNYCWELTSGIKPVPETWRQWNLSSLIHDESGQSFTESGNQPYDFPALYSTLENLEDILAHGSEQLTKSASNLTDEEKGKQPVTNQKKRFARESSHAGPGLQMERVIFHLGSPSPLIRHFLTAKHLPIPASNHHGVSHAQISEQTQSAPTYQDLIEEHKIRARSQLQHYDKLKMDADRDIKKILTRKRRVAQEINKLKGNLGQMKITGHDLKLLIDRMLAAMADKGNMLLTAATQAERQQRRKQQQQHSQLAQIEDEESESDEIDSIDGSSLPSQ